MDDRRFDALVKSLATGTSRRTLFRGLLGLGGAAAIGGAVLDDGADAARRPTPTPTPIRCPGNQTPVGGVCTCPASAPNKCGPDCCNPAGIGAAHSECCDNACCFGLCYGEELCCPWPRTFCTEAQECCDEGVTLCCGEVGCCAGGCCQDAQGNDLCCSGATPKCCPGDTCIAAGGCCVDDDCLGCQSCTNHICVDNDANCPGGANTCLECVNGACLQDNANCDDGNACTSNTCNTDGSCTHSFNCNLAAGCCVDPDPCTANICNDDGTCSFPFFCSSNDCCDDGFPCNTNICNADGTCAPPIVDCRNPGCACFPSDACFTASCNQETGTCQQVASCSVECCAEINPDEGCLSNGRCTPEGGAPNAGGTEQIGACYYDIFCATPCCATYVLSDSFCQTEGPNAGLCVVPF